ncbi:MAG: L-threonylcarbamoyladenylate synthase RimN [Bacteroidetes bacterium HLUCCA01]|nr:MAG: L-threonylcarbamoyladenylate synthase RimN [Bacteroidetes bacterium HLUCCA01]
MTHSLSHADELTIDTYAQILRSGGVVAFPTETVYGLGASAHQLEAVNKIFALKGRPADNPLIVHVSSYAMILEFAAVIPDSARILIQKFWPGPLTLVFEKKKSVLDAVTAGLTSVAVRMPEHELALALIDASGPLVAPSANKSGKPSPTRVSHVQEDFGNHIPVLDGGNCQIGLESTVLDVRKSPFVILRPGSVTASMIQEKTGLEVIDIAGIPDQIHHTPASPGLKYSHYAPEKPVRWMNSDECEGQLHDSTLYLTHSGDYTPVKDRVVNFNRDYTLMGQSLYDWFRRSDKLHSLDIAVQPFTESDSSTCQPALENRISKAISRHNEK